MIRWCLHATPCGVLRLGAFGGRLCLCDWADVPARDFVVRRLERGLHVRFAPWPDDGSLSGSGPRGISDTPDPDGSGNPEVSDDFGAPGNPNVSDDFSAPGNPGVSDDFDAPGNPGAFGDPDSGESDHADRCVLDRAVRQLDEYFAAQRRTFDIPLLTVGTPFQRAVWELLTEIPPRRNPLLRVAGGAAGTPAGRAGRRRGQPCQRPFDLHSLSPRRRQQRFAHGLCRRSGGQTAAARAGATAASLLTEPSRPKELPPFTFDNLFPPLRSTILSFRGPCGRSGRSSRYSARRCRPSEQSTRSD